MKLCWMVRGSSPAWRRRMASSLPIRRLLSGEIDLAGIELLHRRGDFQAEPGGVEQLAIGDHEADAFDALAFEVRLRRA